jgi:hypothetical protein
VIGSLGQSLSQMREVDSQEHVEEESSGLRKVAGMECLYIVTSSTQHVAKTYLSMPNI